MPKKRSQPRREPHPALAAWEREQRHARSNGTGQNGNGRKGSAVASAGHDARTAAVIERQVARFKERFGREPGPREPIFFDPEAPEPRPFSSEQLAAGFQEMIDAVTGAGLDPAFIQAWQEVGYLVSTQNRQLYSADELRAFEAAVLRHRQAAGRGLDAASGGEEAGEAAGGGADQADDTSGHEDAPRLGEVVMSLADGFERVIARTLREPDPRPARDCADSLPDAGSDETDQLIAACAFAVLSGWLTGARESGAAAEPVIDWIAQRLGDRAATAVVPISGLIGLDRAPKVSLQDAADQLDESLVAALLWLACGVAATAGDGDARWLRQFDLTGLDGLDGLDGD